MEPGPPTKRTKTETSPIARRTSSSKTTMASGNRRTTTIRTAATVIHRQWRPEAMLQARGTIPDRSGQVDQTEETVPVAALVTGTETETVMQTVDPETGTAHPIRSFQRPLGRTKTKDS